MPDDLIWLAGRSSGEPEPDMTAIADWLEHVSGDQWIWYAKRLAANDTLATGAHQAGPYLPQALVRRAFPVIMRRHSAELNPDTWIALRVDSHGQQRDVRVVWYNNLVVTQGGTRNEARMTNLGGGESPLLDPEATGALAVFAFELEPDADCQVCRAWLCEGVAEETVAEGVIGLVEPGAGTIHWSSANDSEGAELPPRDCHLRADELPRSWRGGFPVAEELVAKSVERLVDLRRDGISADIRLMRRRVCEFELFRSLEDLHVLPRVASGFRDVESFVAFANAVTNRRKSRSGRSLELQVSAVFDEEGLEYSHGRATEGNKRPDFLFPSADAYHDPGFPTDRLRMLAAKTTCKDRWRQILNEADRIRGRFLLTLQEGVSVGQWREMEAHQVVLVAPNELHRKYPLAVRPHLLSLDQFIESTAGLL
jgi:hypothetical protein